MKKLSIIFFSIIIFVSQASSAFAVTASLPHVTVEPDAAISIPLTVNNVSDLEGADIIIGFDESVIQPTEAPFNLDCGMLADQNYSYQVSTNIAGQLTIVIFANASLFSGSGEIGCLHFDVVGDAEDSSPLQFVRFDINEENLLNHISDGSVTIIDPNPAILTADFSADPVSGLAPLQVNFTDESEAGTNPITTWAWDFGDGQNSNVQHPVHTYDQPGDYSVELTVSDDFDNIDNEVKNNCVQVSVLNAAFGASRLNGIAPFTVTFTDSSTAISTQILNWEWDFDNNGSIDAEGVGPHSYEYLDVGEYDVSLTISDGVSNVTETKFHYIFVSDQSTGDLDGNNRLEIQDIIILVDEVLESSQERR